MVYMASPPSDFKDITRMPRGGPDASCLDRMLQTDRDEYLDRDSDGNPADEARKRSVVRALERTGEWFGNHERFAAIALEEVAEVPDPRILELGSGHGGLSAKLLEMHPTAHLTVTDLEPNSVAAIAAGELGDHPRATVAAMDATSIDAPDGHFDLAVFALSFHHLPPAAAARVFAEGTRAAKKLLIIDLPRLPAPLHLVQLAVMLPFAPFVPFVHDGVISSLRCYSPSALRALAAHADPAIDVDLRGGLTSPQVVVATRH
ncbi:MULTISPECIES: class I SAM-dependent methyltransferase [unclassified Mycolicibacterium]|uniref:class I SAM-dependent methyltransferase n=1 Tax=unclassified Mycolicibacterium TaxID=2636767 RepID=UPI001F4C4BA9|nr:class I SAM-dependent methyltransferase [Mycolicibacterium sp. YH-1]UNB53282.1 methyltransferase domain-containing protein [Mycolicibacterium sp. YH-1]